jgi:pimeloyl-ACP methyl ester carboxylesterase
MTGVGFSPIEILDRVEARSKRIETPCGTGQMVWRVWGDGPPLVLLHGGYGSWRHWIHTIPHFEGRYRLLVPDIPGLGDSDDAPEATPSGIAAVVADGLARLVPPTNPIDLVGFSFGALIGSHVAVFPHPLRSLTLVGAGALGLMRRNIVLLKPEPGMTSKELRELNRKNLGALMIANPAKIDDLAIAIQEINVGRARVKSRRFANSTAIADALRQSRPEQLNAIWGENDAIAVGHFEQRKALLRGIRPDVSFNLFPDAGHWAAYDSPKAFNGLLDSLLDQR